METRRCEAIVLGAMDYREADRIVTLFTLEHGKLRGIAPGAKRSVRRFAGVCEPFARLHLQVALREGLSRVQGADLVTVFPGIRRELVKIAHGGYACELTDQLLPEGVPNPRLFRLLAAYLEHLDGAPFDPSDRRFFEMNLLNILGYRPALDQCVACGAELAGEGQLRFSVAAGGILCSHCGRDGRPVEPFTVILLGRTLRIGRFGAVSFPTAALREAGDLLDEIIAGHLVRPLKSLLFLQELGE
jgi:DNA repair protein RecO (recombination protein O)